MFITSGSQRVKYLRLLFWMKNLKNLSYKRLFKFKIDWFGHKEWKFLNLFTNFTNAVIIKLKIHKSGPLFS